MLEDTLLNRKNLIRNALRDALERKFGIATGAMDPSEMDPSEAFHRDGLDSAGATDLGNLDMTDGRGFERQLIGSAETCMTPLEAVAAVRTGSNYRPDVALFVLSEELSVRVSGANG